MRVSTRREYTQTDILDWALQEPVKYLKVPLLLLVKCYIFGRTGHILFDTRLDCDREDSFENPLAIPIHIRMTRLKQDLAQSQYMLLYSRSVRRPYCLLPVRPPSLSIRSIGGMHAFLWAKRWSRQVLHFLP
jgi:hypothetical protein